MGKIVITGVGVVSAVGNSKQCFWEALRNGETPFRRITRFHTPFHPAPWGAEIVDFEFPIPVKPKQPWTASRCIQFAIGAAQQALTDAGLAPDQSNGSRSNGTEIGVVFGSTRSCLDLVVKLDQDAVERGPRTVDPLLFPDANPAAPSCRVSLHLGLNAFNTILSNGPTAGLDAVSYACRAIHDGLAPVVLAGGVEELTAQTFLFRDSMELVAEPGSCAPFRRQGVVLGEGCAVLVLEDEQHARKRKATILAEVSGYGTCFWPEPAGADDVWRAPEFAMRYAMAEAHISAKQVDVVFASANGDPCGDALEARALECVLPSAPHPALKASLGETHSAAGCLHAAACVMAIQSQALPPDRMVADAAAPGAEIPRPIRVGLVNCFSTSSSTQTYSSLVLRASELIQ
jgi:3-oxoacyl-(acyl-carrier-protein) synthase